MPHVASNRLAWLASLLVGLLGCDAFDSGLLDPASSKNGGNGMDTMDGGPDEDAAAADEDGGGDDCLPSTETCNGLDDDCDDAVDEDTLAQCEEQILNANTGCFPIMDGARCLLVRCERGFFNCDGDPTNGCEQPFCACNPCDDAGADDDAGTL
ncbi:MAG: hypothetical protein OXT09_07165 [Myxococcales bacterium]|nr:hypothetical protein [Myxococcales bacterium]